MSFKVTITPDPVADLDEIVQAHGGPVVYQAIGAAVFDVAQDHLAMRDREPNKTGFPKQHFWERVSRGTRQESDATSATIVFPYPMRAKVAGAEIKPVRGKYLTIPAIAAAYGKRAGEFDLRFAIVDGIGPALVTKDPEAVVVFRLVRRAVLPPDPEALPSDERILAAATRALDELRV